MSRDRRDTIIGIVLGLLAVAAIVAMMRWITGPGTGVAPSPGFLPLGPRGSLFPSVIPMLPVAVPDLISPVTLNA